MRWLLEALLSPLGAVTPEAGPPHQPVDLHPHPPHHPGMGRRRFVLTSLGRALVAPLAGAEHSS